MAPDRKPRGDFPGAWHHVMNRGIAHRAAFEGRSDVRAFLALLAWAVHAGEIEVHAFTILTTHFHLLLRSPLGELSNAMMWIENQYVKYFNRLRDRDGPLFRSRFRSRLIDSDEYWFNVIRYIDANPVEARLCARPGDYEFGSARMYCGAKSAPWLTRKDVEATVRSARRSKTFSSADYEKFCACALDSDERWVIERRIDRGAPNADGKEWGNELLRSSSDQVLEWLRSRAKLADGGGLGLTLAAPAQVERVVREAIPRDESGARPMEAGLLRELCGLTLGEIAGRMRISVNAVWKLSQRHRELLVVDGPYAELVTRVLDELKRDRVPSLLRNAPVENPGGLGLQPAPYGRSDADGRPVSGAV